MILTIYKKHLNEISAFVRDFVVPNIKSVASEIDTTPKTWNNWSDRGISISEKVSVKFCINRSKNTSTGNKHELANDIHVWIRDVAVCSVALDGEMMHQGDPWRGSYKYGDISTLVGEIRKVASSVEFLTNLEKDALQE